MKSLRIVMFTTFYPPYSFGGDAIGVQRMARALAARGHRVTVVHDEDSYLVLGGSAPVSTPRADDVQRIGLRSKNGFLSNLLTQQTGRPVIHAPRIRRLLDDIRPDIIWYNNTSLVGGPGLLEVDVNPNRLRQAFGDLPGAMSPRGWDIRAEPGLGIEALPEELDRYRTCHSQSAA